MPRYLFHFALAHDFVPDSEGVELSDIKAAHRHALRLVQQTLRFFRKGAEWRGWIIEIADVEGNRVLTVLFPAVPERDLYRAAWRSSEAGAIPSATVAHATLQAFLPCLLALTH